LYYVDRTAVLEQARQGGFGWIRQQVPWKDTERADRGLGTDELDRIVESVNASGRKLLLSLVKSPEFLTSGPGDTGLPNDPADFGRFAGLIAERYKGRVHAIEVWNEQNLAVENGGNVVPEDAGHYVEVLKAGYTAIKAVDPNIVVIAGAPSSTGVTQPDLAVDDLTYLQAMYAYNNGEIRDYMDAQGFHPASTLNAPQYSFPDNVGPTPEGCPGSCWKDSPTHFFRHIENFIQVMYNSGMGDKPIWITEMGWATANTTPGYDYGNFVSDEQQAAYHAEALREIVLRYDKYVDAVFVWNLNFGPLWQAQGDPQHEQAAFGLIAPDGSPRPSYTAIQSFITSVEAGQVPPSIAAE
jgi:polysaccharide biosynthesis protein PslG